MMALLWLVTDNVTGTHTHTQSEQRYFTGIFAKNSKYFCMHMYECVNVRRGGKQLNELKC